MASRYALIGVWVVLAGIFAIIEPGTLFTTGTFDTIFGPQLALVSWHGGSGGVRRGEFDLSISAILGWRRPWCRCWSPWTDGVPWQLHWRQSPRALPSER